MECHDARTLMLFARSSESMDAGEKTALQQHLDGCPDCAARAQAERHADETLTKLMQDVPVPADLQAKLLKRLADERPAKPWRWVASAAALVLLIVATVGGVKVWQAAQPPVVTFDDVRDFAHKGASVKEEELQNDFGKFGIKMQLPGMLDNRHLQRAEIGEFMNRRVARLMYRVANNDGSTTTADVLVLPEQEFNTNQLPSEKDFPGANIQIQKRGSFLFIILYNGRFENLKPAGL